MKVSRDVKTICNECYESYFDCELLIKDIKHRDGHLINLCSLNCLHRMWNKDEQLQEISKQNKNDRSR